jgi:hypothetical protein
LFSASLILSLLYKIQIPFFGLDQEKYIITALNSRREIWLPLIVPFQIKPQRTGPEEKKHRAAPSNYIRRKAIGNCWKGKWAIKLGGAGDLGAQNRSKNRTMKKNGNGIKEKNADGERGFAAIVE